MNFEVFTTNVELQDIPSYTTNITLEGQLLKLSFTWNERVGKRTLSIKNDADVCYLQNKILHPNEPLELNSNAVFDDLPYKVVLQKVGDIKRVGNIYNWSKDFILCFYRTVDEEQEKLNVRYNVTTPSTPIIPPTQPTQPYLYLAYHEVDFENLKLILMFGGENFGDIIVTDPNGSIVTLSPNSGDLISLDYLEGFYTLSSSLGFSVITEDNLIYPVSGDIYIKSSLNTEDVPSPLITSVTRDVNNIVYITGTAKPFSVVWLISDTSNQDAIMYSKVLEESSDFSFEIELPPNFTGFCRCLDGNKASAGTALFTI